MSMGACRRRGGRELEARVGGVSHVRRVGRAPPHRSNVDFIPPAALGQQGGSPPPLRATHTAAPAIVSNKPNI